MANDVKIIVLTKQTYGAYLLPVWDQSIQISSRTHSLKLLKACMTPHIIMNKGEQYLIHYSELQKIGVRDDRTQVVG